MLVSDALHIFLQDCQIGLSPLTVRNYTYNLERLTAYLAERGVKSLGRIKANHLRNYLAHLSQQPTQKRGHHQPPSIATLHQSYRVIRAWLNWCVEQGLLAANPVYQVRQPELPRPVARHISLSAMHELLRTTSHTAKPERDRALVMVCLDTGLRRQEVANLTLADLDLPGRRLTVRLGKGNKGRIVPFTAATAHALAVWLVAREGAGPLKSLFGLNAHGVYQMMRRLKRRAGLPDLTPHMLRHTFATYYGGDIYDLAKILGHRDIKVTAETYAHRDVERLVHLHDRLSPVRHVEIADAPPTSFSK